MGLASGRWAAWAAGGAAAIGGFALVMVAASCLPDLTATSAVTDAKVPPSAPDGCGDGFINPEAGEECDPGDAATVGCSNLCRVICGLPEASSYVDPSTKHCYFAQAEAGTFAQAEGHCSALKAHPVTFVSEDEFLAVTASSLPPQFWVGLQVQEAQSGMYLSSNLNEPGWAPSTECSGCYAHLKNPTDMGFPRIIADGGGGCVVGTRGAFTWNSANCGFAERIVCEREPPGSRARFANQGWDITIAATLGSKRYFYSPVPTDAPTAESTCRALSDAGTGRLVVFASREEREQLLKEIIEVNGNGNFQFWIGLSWSSDAGVDPDGGGETGGWVWDDGEPLSAGVGHPVPWGDKAPETNGPNRAFVQVVPHTYDTQLSHSTTIGNGIGYVCQY